MKAKTWSPRDLGVEMVEDDLGDFIHKDDVHKLIEEKDLEKDLERILWDLQVDLIQSDVGVETSELIVERLREMLTGEGCDRDK